MNDWTTLTQFDSVIEAETLKSFLESEDIPAFVQGAHVGDIVPHHLGGIHLKVQTGDLEKARALLAEFASRPGAESFESTAEEDREWKLRSTVRRASLSALLGIAFAPVIGGAYSLSLFWKAYQLHPKFTRAYRKRFVSSMLLNVISMVVIPYLYYRYVFRAD